MLLIGSLVLNFSQIVSAIYTFEFKRMYLKMSSVKWREMCLGHYVLICFLCWSINPIKIFADISKTALNLCKYALGLRLVVLCVCVCVVQILSHISMNLDCRLSLISFVTPCYQLALSRSWLSDYISFPIHKSYCGLNTYCNCKIFCL